MDSTMDIHAFIKTIESSPEFTAFIKDNPDHYLVHVFSLMDAHHKDDWQAGYYSTETDKITVFEYFDQTIKMLPAQEAFKEEAHIAPLKISIVKVSPDDAIKTVEQVVKESYSAESFVKLILLLQNLTGFGEIWNVTLVTLSFKVINVKIDAATGKVLKHSRESLMGWKK